MNIAAELREAAKTVGKMGTLTARLIDKRYMALCGPDGEVIRWREGEVHAVALAANALPDLLAERESYITYAAATLACLFAWQEALCKGAPWMTGETKADIEGKLVQLREATPPDVEAAMRVSEGEADADKRAN